MLAKIEMVEPEIVRHGLELSKWSLSRVVVFDKTGCKIVDQDRARQRQILLPDRLGGDLYTIIDLHV